MPFYLLIPRLPVTQVLGQIHITNKSLVYVVGLQVSACREGLGPPLVPSPFMDGTRVSLPAADLQSLHVAAGFERTGECSVLGGGALQRCAALLTSAVFADLGGSVPRQRPLFAEAPLHTHVDVPGGTLSSGAALLK